MAKEILPSELLSGELPPSESAFDVVVAAGLVVAAFNVWRMVDCSLKYCGREHLKIYNNYGKIENSIDETGSEIKQKFDDIKTLVETVKTKVNNVGCIERDGFRSNAFVEKLQTKVEMIEIEMEEFKNKIAFALNKTQELALSIQKAEDKDNFSTVTSNVATVVTSLAYVSFSLSFQIAAGAITLGNMINSGSQYRSRKNERDDFRSNLKSKSAYFDQMQLELERRLEMVKDSLKMAK